MRGFDLDRNIMVGVQSPQCSRSDDFRGDVDKRSLLKSDCADRGREILEIGVSDCNP
jgi:hypothetical protein